MFITILLIIASLYALAVALSTAGCLHVIRDEQVDEKGAKPTLYGALVLFVGEFGPSFAFAFFLAMPLLVVIQTIARLFGDNT